MTAAFMVEGPRIKAPDRIGHRRRADMVCGSAAWDDCRTASHAWRRRSGSEPPTGALRRGARVFPCHLQVDVKDLLLQPGIQGVAQAVAELVEADDHDHDGQAGDGGPERHHKKGAGAHLFRSPDRELQRQEVDCGKHIHGPHPETQCNCTWDVGVHVQGNRHQSRPRTLSLAMSDDGFCFVRSSSTVFKRSAISLSSSSRWSQ